MAYFSCSPFYDRSCINERAILQGLTQQAAAQLTGVEYRVIPTGQEPKLFRIHETRRLSPTRVDLTAAYYVSGGSIFRAPDVFRVLAARLETAAFHVGKAAETTSGDTSWDASRGHSWSQAGAGVTSRSGGSSAARVAYLAGSKRPREPAVGDGSAVAAVAEAEAEASIGQVLGELGAPMMASATAFAGASEQSGAASDVQEQKRASNPIEEKLPVTGSSDSDSGRVAGAGDNELDRPKPVSKGPLPSEVLAEAQSMLAQYQTMT